MTHSIRRPLVLCSLGAASLALALAGCSSADAPSATTAESSAAAPSATASLADVPYVPRAKCGDEPRNNFVALSAAWNRTDLPDGCEGIIDGGSHWGAKEQAVFDAHPGLSDETFLAAYGACAYPDFRPYQGELTPELEEQARVSLDICPTNPGAEALRGELGA